MNSTEIAWRDMHRRCYNTTCRSYPNYGGRGITVCVSWFSYAVFLQDMKRKPVGLSLERKDNNAGYSPENCIWGTRSANNANRRVFRNSTSKITGVSWDGKRWLAYFNRNYGRSFLYTGRDFFEACCARKSWESHQHAC